MQDPVSATADRAKRTIYADSTRTGAPVDAVRWVVPWPDPAADPADTWRAHVPIWIACPPGDTDSPPPFPEGTRDYHPIAIEPYLDRSRLLRFRRGWGLLGGVGRPYLLVHKLIVTAWSLFAHGQPPALLAHGATFAFFAGLALLVGALFGLGAVTLYIVVSLGVLTAFPFVMEKVIPWPTGREAIQSAVDGDRKRAAGRMITLEARLDAKRIWQEYVRDVQDAPVTAHVTTQDLGGGRLAVQFWLFYYFNDWANIHDSDWEMVTIFFDGAEPDYLFCSSHEGGMWRPWDAVEKDPRTGRPLVYVAIGSHGQYFEPNPDGWTPSALVSPGGFPFKARVWLSGSGGPKDWCPAVAPCDVGSLEEIPMGLVALKSDGSEPWWLQYRGSWSRAEDIDGPAITDKWKEPVAWARDRGVGDPGLFGFTDASGADLTISGTAKKAMRGAAKPILAGIDATVARFR